MSAAGGLKLEAAIKYFEISSWTKFAMDVGSSTGGFTDVMLQQGTRKCIVSTSDTVSLHGSSGRIRALCSSKEPIFVTSKWTASLKQ